MDEWLRQLTSNCTSGFELLNYGHPTVTVYKRGWTGRSLERTGQIKRLLKEVKQCAGPDSNRRGKAITL